MDDLQLAIHADIVDRWSPTMAMETVKSEMLTGVQYISGLR